MCIPNQLLLIKVAYNQMWVQDMALSFIDVESVEDPLVSVGLFPSLELFTDFSRCIRLLT